MRRAGKPGDQDICRSGHTLSFSIIKNLKLWRAGKRRRAHISLSFIRHDLALMRRARQPVAQLLQDMPAVVGDWPQAGGGPLVFAVCDPKYFSLHADTLLASIDKYSPGSALHLHLYDPRPHQLAELQALQQRFRQVTVTSTWERTELGGLTDEQRIIYYQSTRFVRLYSVLQAARCPVITVDIDSLIRGPLTQIVQAAGDADIGLFLRPELCHSGKNVLASMVYAAPSAASLHFFAQVAARIAVHLLARAQVEMLDQRCLWKIYDSRNESLQVWEIPLKFSDWSLADDSIIWHGKGPRKQTEKYLRERALSLSGDVGLAAQTGSPATQGIDKAFRQYNKRCDFRVGWKPQNDEPRVASTRIRCLNPMAELQRRGFPVELYSAEHIEAYDMVIFLKAYSEKDIALAKELKARGKVVIFDLCDNHFLMDEERLQRLKEMFQLADHWVTSTPALAEVIQENVGNDGRPIHVIEDAVEEAVITSAFDVRGRARARWQMAALIRFLGSRKNRDSTHLVWFGNYKGSYKDSGLPHVGKLQPLLERIHARHRLSLTVISNSRSTFDQVFKGWMLPAFYMDWNPFNFYQAMQQHAITIIPIDVNEFTKVKTNNRVVLSLYLGLGVIADSIPSYAEFSECAFMDDWENGLHQYITHPGLIANHVEAGRRIIAEKYSLPVIADKWDALFHEVWELRLSHVSADINTSEEECACVG